MSRFERTDNVKAEGGPAGYVLAWLDYAAQRNQRQGQQLDERQLSLF